MKKVFRLFDFENFVKKDNIFGNNDEVEENEILTLDIFFSWDVPLIVSVIARYVLD